MKVLIKAEVETEVKLGENETIDQYLNRSVDICLHGEGEDGAINKEDLGGNSSIKIIEPKKEIERLESLLNDTAENNELIAEFYYSTNKEHPQIDGSLPCGSYHDSWDWLMPIVKKIKKLMNEANSDEPDIQLYFTDGTERDLFYIGSDLVVTTNIKHVYKDIVDFLNWFNKMKKRAEVEKHLDQMKIGKMNDHIKSNGILNSTREYIKNSADEFEMNNMTDGWITATLTKEELIKYILGEINDSNLDWK